MNMKEILDKITSYNLFNYLLPGILFVFGLNFFTQYSLVQENLVFGIFLYYFVGLVISRFGSVVIEPLLRMFVKFSKHDDYISASKNDPKIEILLLENNMHRTFIAMLFLFLFVKFYEYLSTNFQILNTNFLLILVILLIILFIFSYRKQVGYIKSRVENSKRLE